MCVCVIVSVDLRGNLQAGVFVQRFGKQTSGHYSSCPPAGQSSAARPDGSHQAGVSTHTPTLTLKASSVHTHQSMQMFLSSSGWILSSAAVRSSCWTSSLFRGEWNRLDLHMLPQHVWSDQSWWAHLDKNKYLIWIIYRHFKKQQCHITVNILTCDSIRSQLSPTKFCWS